MSAPVPFLVDAGVGTAVEAWRRAAGHDVASVRDRDPRAVDPDILAWAVRERRMVVTMDKDFGELVFRSGLPHGGVLLLRLEDADSAAKVRAVEAVVTGYGDQMPGRFCVFHNGKLRIR